MEEKPDRRDEMSKRRKSESMLVVWVSLLINASLPVHVGLWNGVNWMVALVFYLLTAVSELICIVCAEISIAPNVKLMRRQRL